MSKRKGIFKVFVNSSLNIVIKKHGPDTTDLN